MGEHAMTDKTDIAALRSAAANIIGLLTAAGHETFSLDKAADFFDDVFRLLEAERQRGDKEEALNKHLDLAVRAAEGVANSLRRQAEKAEEELAALRGEQEPVTMDDLRDAVAEMSGGLPMEWRETTSKGHHGVPFINFNSLHRIVSKFTRQPKPVVVLSDGWKLVPIEPTEDMVISGFESKPSQSFSPAIEWEAYDAMSGCQQAAYSAKLCWDAMLRAAPKPEM